MQRTLCGDFVKEDVAKLEDQKLQLAGWVHRRRDLGGLIFIQLRDRSGILQVVFEPDDTKLFKQAELRFKKQPELSNRYIELARKIAMKYKVKIPRELKRKFCKPNLIQCSITYNF